MARDRGVPRGAQAGPGGGFGRRARSLAAASWVPNVPLALGFAAGLLLAATPTTAPRCRPDPAPRNASGPGGGSGGGSACLVAPGTPNASSSAPCAGDWQEAPPEVGLLRSTPVTQWGLVCSNHWKVPLEETTHLLGWLVGFVAFGAACDRFGRRGAFVWAVLLSVPCGLAVALAVSFVMFVLARLAFGAMLAGAFISLYIARLELCDPPHRLGVTMIAGFFWVSGELLWPALAVACREWRLLQGAIVLGCTLVAAGWWCPSLFPESARWLLATRQLQEGRRALRGLAGVRGPCAEEEEDPDAEERPLADPEDLPEEAPGPQFHGLCHLLATRVVWKNCLILGFTAFIGSGIRHCFSRNLAPYSPRPDFPSFLLPACEAVALLFLWLTADRFGRRAVLLLSTVLTGGSALLLLALMQYLVAWLVLALSLLGILASQAATALSVLFAGEVLPTVVRGSGLGLILAARSLGWAAAPLLDIHNRRGFFLHHVVFASFAILSVLSLMLLPESAHKPLPETLREGESQRRPPLFCAPRHGHRHGHRQDHLPLLAGRSGPGSYDDPDSYARLATATKKMLAARTGAGGKQARGALLRDPLGHGGSTWGQL